MPPAIHSLKSVFRKGINYLNYSEMLAAAKNKSVGRLPAGIMDVVTEGYPKSARGEVISQIREAYTDCVKALHDIEKVERQAFNRLPANDNAYIKFNRKINGALDAEGLPSREELYPFKDAIFTEKETEISIMAEQALANKLSSIMPDLKNVIITPLGSGNFSRTYKMELVFQNPAKRIEPQVLKVYRDSVLSESELATQLRYFHNISNKTIAKITESSVNQAKKSKNKSINELNKVLQEVRAENYGSFGHGAMSEANASEYLRYMTGHNVVAKDGLVIPDFYSFGETPFSISQYVENGSRAEKSFNFKRLGLSHTDFEQNSNNGIGGICIDIGGIMPAISERYGKKSNIVGNKTGTKVLKNFFKLKTASERSRYLENLIDNSPKIKNNTKRREILDAVDEILGSRLNEIG